MARPRKMRCICAYPKSMEFRPFGEYAETVDLNFDEYESARTKIADAIVNGKALVIHGGDVELCPNSSTCCGRCGQRDCDACGHCEQVQKLQGKSAKSA